MLFDARSPIDYIPDSACGAGEINAFERRDVPERSRRRCEPDDIKCHRATHPFQKGVVGGTWPASRLAFADTCRPCDTYPETSLDEFQCESFVSIDRW